MIKLVTPSTSMSINPSAPNQNQSLETSMKPVSNTPQSQPKLQSQPKPQNRPGVPYFPPSMHVMTDLEQVKVQRAPCLVQCPKCRYTGLTIIKKEPNVCLALLAAPLIFFGLGIIIMLYNFEKVHYCSHCSEEICRDKLLCC